MTPIKFEVTETGAVGVTLDGWNGDAFATEVRTYETDGRHVVQVLDNGARIRQFEGMRSTGYFLEHNGDLLRALKTAFGNA